MRARALFILAVCVLTGCELADPKTSADARGDAYGVPSRLDEQPSAPAVDQAPDPIWPRRFASDGSSFATYEPRIESWKDDRLAARVPVEVYPPGATAPIYGLVWFEAPTRTDRARGVVTLGDVRVTRVSFPTAKEREAAYLQALRGADLAESKTVALDRLQQQVAYGAQPEPLPSQAVKNDPPVVLVTERPTVLLLVDGPPRYRDDGGVQRVINTRALIVSDRGSFFAWVGDRWFQASSIDGAYSEAKDVPRALDELRARLATSETTDLQASQVERVRQGARVAVATKPTEVIETNGAPAYEPIPGTTLTYVTNTQTDVLRDEAGARTYVLLGGRWYRAPSLSGPWAFVAGKDLPATFRAIPKDHREGRVLSSIPGTPQAEEAAIAASIPQTATVDRAQARLAVAYDGPPDFQPVEGTNGKLKYAINTATPVIAASDGNYYAVENGVWFVAPAPEGPWEVATQVPEDIYGIPPSSPIHYVTYVRIYGYSPQYAYVGYTPGYFGAIYTGGVVVFGTGYAYRPWVGHVWYGWPRYWAPVGGWYGPVVTGNVYRRWSPTVVHAPPARVAYAPPVSAPRAMHPASPTVGPRVTGPGGPRVMTPASPSVVSPERNARTMATPVPRPAPAPPPSFSQPSVSPRIMASPPPPISAPPASPRIMATPPPSIAAPPPASPRIMVSPPPRISAPPVSPRMMAPPPRISAPPAAPRMMTPAAPSMGPRGGGGMIRANPGAAVRGGPRR